MKEYIITVNGISYEVTVEEKSRAGAAGKSTVMASSASAPAQRPAAAPQPKPAPSPAEDPVQAGTPSQPVSHEGAVSISAPMPGKILRVLKNPGDTVKAGETILVLEAMKMENEIQAPQDGTLISAAAEGTAVEMGSTIAEIQ